MSLPLIIAGGLAVIAGVALFVVRRSGAAYAALCLGVLLLLGAFVFPRVSQEAEDLPHVAFVAPTDGAEVPAGEVDVSVRLTNATLATSSSSPGGHLHLYVDEELVQMPYASVTTILLHAGSHRLRVEYVDERHVSFNPPIQDSIAVVAA